MQRDRRLPKVVVAVLLAGLIAVLGLLVTRPDPHAQVEATFARIQSAFAEGDARDLLAEVHADYDLQGQWPVLADRIAVADDRSDGGESPFRRQLRAQLGRYFLFMRQRGVSHAFTYQVHDVSEVAERTYLAHVTVRLVGEGGSLPRSVDPALTAHPFRLISSGWLFPATAIVDHDPISL